MLTVGAGTVSKANAVMLMQAAAKQLEYQDRGWDIEQSITTHPFMRHQTAIWCGSPGVTDSIGIWFNAIMSELVNSYGGIVIEMRVWYCTITPTQRDYIFDAKIHDIHYLVSGTNNYSGTGGAGGKLVERFVDALADLLENDLQRRGMINITQEGFDRAMREHSDAIMEARQEAENER